MLLLLFLLSVQPDPGQETAELLRKLGSDLPEERDRATARLKQIGPSAADALKEVVRTGEGELRERAREILADFDRVARIMALRPSDRRISVRLHEVFLAEALPQLLHPFGMTNLKISDELANRKVTLSLENSAFWEALDRLEEAAKVLVDLSSGEIRAGARTTSEWSGRGDVRVSATSWGSRGGSKIPTQDLLSLHAWLPPGSWACSAELENLVTTDETGKIIAGNWQGALDGIRHYGRPSYVELGGLAILPDHLKGLKTVTVSGTLKLGLPRDLERRVMDKLPGKLLLLGGSVSVQKLLKSERWGWDLSVDSEGGDEPFTVLLSVEDAAGRWLGDLQTLTQRSRGSSGSSRSVELLPGTPARCVVHRPVGQDILETPFTLTVPGPRR
jgi:hypothetical protein